MEGDERKLYTDELSQFLSPVHEMDIFLVSVDVKPASSVYLQASQKNAKGLELFDEQIKQTLAKLDLKFSFSKKTYPANPEVIINSMFNIARNNKNLSALDNAQTPLENGIAFGYPEKAVHRFQEAHLNGYYFLGYDFMNYLTDSKRSGIEIPKFVAYLSHLPAKWETQGGKMVIEEESQVQCELYMEVIKEKNPQLGLRIEAEHEQFLMRKIKYEDDLKNSFRNKLSKLAKRIRG